MKLLSDKQLANTHGGWWTTDQVGGAACAAVVLGFFVAASVTFSPLGAAAVLVATGMNVATCSTAITFG
ncbi:hypothetical protein [Neolewinella agarilytica]|uniref:Uncharacterized protein n=1 Tax=Neolewinella agarilytica TaxID=478744 RepID=A0A1H9AEP1_9BACT|nr:hypothetical protein [Neolewinella agarilytica]SEP74957.1 hypothetical protein SAMN05444359_10264 [Neolewinella agarilytica]